MHLFVCLFITLKRKQTYRHKSVHWYITFHLKREYIFKLLKEDQLQTKSQRNREASQGQDEHIHIGTELYGAYVWRDGTQTRQADCPSHGGAAFAIRQRCSVRLSTDSEAPACLHFRERVECIDPASGPRLLRFCRRLRPR